MAPLAPDLTDVVTPSVSPDQPTLRASVTSRRPDATARPADAMTMDFDSFYRREYVSMVGIARGICGDHQQAEDLAQEALARAHQRWDQISTYDRPGAWLRRVTINLALSRRRRISRELSFLRRSAGEAAPAAMNGGEPGGGPDEEVWAAVAQLAPRQRAAITLFYQEDLSTSDIADALGCAVSTATSHLNQARTRLAKILGETADDEEPAR